MARFISILLLTALSSALFLSGCATYGDLPAGTHKTITMKPDGVLEREAVTVSGDTSSVAIPMPPRPYDYVIGPNDILYVSVNGKPEFTPTGTGIKGYRVDGRGYVYLPIAGSIPVSGSTIGEARETIRKAMLRYFNDPWVVVEITEYRTRQVFVFGAVKKPGPLTMPASGLNIAQAIANAELRDTGYNFKRVRVIRSNSPTSGELMVIDFDNVLRGKAIPILLQEGDIVYVPKSALGNWNEALAEILPSLQTVSGILQPFVTIKYLENN